MLQVKQNNNRLSNRKNETLKDLTPSTHTQVTYLDLQAITYKSYLLTLKILQTLYQKVKTYT